MEKQFRYADQRFADIQMLRYKLEGFDALTTRQKALAYCLAEAALYGRDIITDQNGRFNLIIRKTLEAIYTQKGLNHETENFKALETYLKRIWFANGIYHHYGCDKFKPCFTEDYFKECLEMIDVEALQVDGCTTATALFDTLQPIIFREDVLPKKVNKADGDDLVVTSACNFYEGVTQQEAEDFYNNLKAEDETEPPSYGLNSTLVKRDQRIYEDVWHSNGKYGPAIKKIVACLEEAMVYAENEKQKKVIQLLIDYYNTGDLKLFNQHSIAWLQCLDTKIDFINGFIEVYSDPLGLKGSWEGLVEYVDENETQKTQIISDNAQWFEDHSPIDNAFKKAEVKGVSARVICAAMLGGEEYPSTAIGINLPNADWIRARYGSKSITIANITDAYDKASQGNGFYEEFVADTDMLKMIKTYGTQCDNIHTHLHECLGHGSGLLLPTTDPDALKAYGNTIEEARADLFGLYFMADKKITELGLLPDNEAYKTHYYTYLLNGLMTQLVRIEPGNSIEEAHMRNRAMIARWCLKNGNAVKLVKNGNRTSVEITDYDQLRELFAQLLREVQRIKSEGDFKAAKAMVEEYAVEVDPQLHAEVLERYHHLGLAPYKGFINPVLLAHRNEEGMIEDVQVDYSEEYEQQMLRYSKQYATLI